MLELVVPMKKNIYRNKSKPKNLYRMTLLTEYITDPSVSSVLGRFFLRKKTKYFLVFFLLYSKENLFTSNFDGFLRLVIISYEGIIKYKLI